MSIHLSRAQLLAGRCLTRFYSTQGSSMNVFDRKTKRIQKNRAADMENYKVFDYVREEFGWRMADRISDVKRKFDIALDLGCGRGYVGKHTYSDMIGTLYQMDMAEKMLAQSDYSSEVPTFNVHGDEEFLPFKKNSLDLVISSLSLHWVNDLPGVFKQIHTALKPDGCFMGCMFGGDTLFELRVSLQLAETEREGGFAPHVSPFTQAQDLGGLLTRTNFNMLTVDVDEMVIRYPSMYELMEDLKGMGENNCSWNRRVHIPRDTLAAAAAIYKEMHGSPDEEGIPATFQVYYFIGWKPDASQAKPAKPGSQSVSFKDINRLSELADQVKSMKKEMQDQSSDGMTDRLDRAIQQLQKDIAKLQSEKDDSNGKKKS